MTRFRAFATLLIGGSIVVTSTVFARHADNQASSLQFSATQMDVAVDGKFGKFTADVDFDLAHPNSGRVNLAIDLGSVATESAEADDLLRGKDFFDIARFPQARFVSNSITSLDAGHFRASGQLTLKGLTSQLVVPFTARQEGAGLRIQGQIPVSRLAFHIGEGQWADTGTLSDLVNIKFSLYVLP